MEKILRQFSAIHTLERQNTTQFSFSSIKNIRGSYEIIEITVVLTNLHMHET